MPRIAALTGTPGTGKTTLQVAASTAGWQVVDVGDLARTEGAVVGTDPDRGVDEVDVAALSMAWRARAARLVDGDRVLLSGHLAHLLPCDIVVVLRCSPAVLRRRLEARGYTPEKVTENVEAEAVDVVLLEALEADPPEGVHELDTSSDDPGTTAALLLRVLEGSEAGHRAGAIDWSGEVLEWF
jgi:adenylate kinase